MPDFPGMPDGRRNTGRLFAAALILLAGLCAALHAGVILVDRGVAKAAIVVRADAVGAPTEPTLDTVWYNQPPPNKVAAAARDLQVYLAKMTGATLPIVGDDRPVPAGKLVLVGRSALTKDFEKTIPAGLTPTRDEEGYRILARGNRLLLAGNDAGPYHGTEYAVANFLHRQGVRWYMPGDFGDFVPPKATVDSGDLDVTGRPDFKMRIWGVGGSFPPGDLGLTEYRWKIRNGMSNVLWDFINFPADSSIYAVLPPPTEREKPENAGVMGRDAGGKPHASMPNLSSEASVQYVANFIRDYFRKHPETKSYGLAGEDGWPMDYTPETLQRNPGLPNVEGRLGLTSDLSTSDEWMDWIQRVAQEVYKEFPDHFITTNGYANRNTPPVSVTPDPKVWVMFAAIWSDTLHAYDNPRSWQTLRQGQMIARWAKMYDNVFMYNYINYMLAGCGAPIPLSRKTARDMPLYKKWGVVGFADEGRTIRTETGVFPTYLRARMMWDSRLDREKELAEFARNWYGPAAKPATAFWEALEEAMETTPWLGHEDRILPYVYSPELLRRLERHVAEAEALANDAWSKPRVAADRVALENLKAYLAMNRAEFDGDFAEAAKQAQRMNDVRATLAPVSRFYYNPYPDRMNDNPAYYYWGCADRIKYYRKVAAALDGTTGNLIALLPETAQCTLDPRDDGRYARWFAPEYDDAGWAAVRTTMPYYQQVPGAVDGQGYPYTGALWYRLSVDVPEQAAGRQVNLYCAAIEPEAWVWVNGQFAGHREFRDCYERPNALDLDVSRALLPGRKNSVVIRVHTSTSAAWAADALCSRLLLYSPKEKPLSQQP